MTWRIPSSPNVKFNTNSSCLNQGKSGKKLDEKFRPNFLKMKSNGNSAEYDKSRRTSGNRDRFLGLDDIALLV
jgi:hypothetical protein